MLLDTSAEIEAWRGRDRHDDHFKGHDLTFAGPEAPSPWLPIDRDDLPGFTLVGVLGNPKADKTRPPLLGVRGCQLPRQVLAEK